MNGPIPPQPKPGRVRFGSWLPGAIFLLTVLLAGGCAAVDGKRHTDHLKPANVRAEKLPFPISRRMAPIAPTVVSYPDYRDPLRGMNRAIFAFNDVTYRFLLIPLSKGYLRVVPAPFQRGISNFFANIKTPISAVNHLLQLQPEPLGRNLLRFGINTTAGLLGIFDPAKAWYDLAREETGFDDTLAHYGAGYGIYLVLPLIGPSDLRNSASLAVDYFLNPIIYLTESPERTAIQGFDFFQEYAPGAEQYQTLRDKSDDPYIFLRNLHLQGVQRDADY